MTNTIDPEKGFLIDCMTDFFDEFETRLHQPVRCFIISFIFEILNHKNH